jgi:hypothetical protein
MGLSTIQKEEEHVMFFSSEEELKNEVVLVTGETE